MKLWKKKWILVLSLGFSSFAWSQIYNQSYCSVAAIDGNWFVQHTRFDVTATCLHARQQLANRTMAPVNGLRSGYLNTYDFQQLSMSCFGYRQFFYGYGLEPLYRAFNTANSMALRSCLFEYY